ncbi:spermidine synthase [Nitzschia inconspicua]|uniref:Spermidine synthase n=1 Tax=Nitzschia inconspicua TaxID=303405 RepID=A0A9K3KUA3_9STRA|nr:spermidine synthase [Nitzschia inconspicua]
MNTSVSILFAVQLAASLLQCEAATSAQDIIDWIQSKANGFVSDKIVWKKANDEDNAFGFFAIDDIPESTHLMVIPQSTFFDPDPDDDEKVNDCETALLLLEEYEKGKDSIYFPFVDFLLGDVTKQGIVPSAWSPQGKKLLRRVIGRALEPQESTDFVCEEECPTLPKNGDKCSQLENTAFFSIISGGWNAKMIPVFGMLPHRNGKWHNVDMNSILPGVNDEVLFTVRDVKAGEQLYISYTECNYEDCKGMQFHYITPDILRDFGIVEQYPRRWRLNDRKELVAQIDKDEASGKLHVSWPLGEYPDIEDLTWIQSQLQRLNKMENEIKTSAAALESSHEKNVIMEYYHGYKELLELAFVYREAGLPMPTGYDTLSSPKGMAVEGRNTAVCDRDPTGTRMPYNFATESQYQEIDFRYSKDADNTCMSLSGWLQTCSTVRPHYHEAFVHIAGQYVEKVKRVIYLGGGDNMILHEILKFPDLELVVGMELDQQVCRSAFQYFGTLPYFDDPRVQWWFGDATKSLLALPESYFGSFDLVLVDLQTFVADALKVTDKLSIMDTAILLMKQNGGVIAKNEDFSVRTNVGFAKYTVDLEYHDLPKFCQQSITLGSNSIDFIKASPKNHGIETLAVDLVGSDTWNPYNAWFGYRQSVPNSCLVSHVPETTMECTSNESGTRAGIFLVLEAEAISTPLDPFSSVQSKISKSIKELGLTEISVSTGTDFDTEVMVLILKEGYVTARVFVEHDYVAFDLHLWESIGSIDSLKEALILGVGGDLKKFTSFRFVTSGMFGLQSCPKDILTDFAMNVQNDICNITNATLPLDTETSVKSAYVNLLQEFLREMLPSLKEGSSSRVVGVLCGDESRSCESLSAIHAMTLAAVEVVPLHACTSFDDMHACEMKTKENFSVDVANKDKLDGLVLDQDMPFQMGQIIDKLFSDKVYHYKLMKSSHIVISPVQRGEDWKVQLVDRFRTDLVLFDPAYRVNMKVYADVLQRTEPFSQWCIFSAGDSHFFNHLSSSIASIESKTGLKAEIEDVANGLINVIADFYPPKVFKNSDYDRSRALSQWQTQSPIGHQTLFQLIVQPPKAKVKEGEIVLLELEEGPWDMVFGRAVVLSECSPSGDDCVVQLESKKKARTVSRSQIRKFSTADSAVNRSFEIGDLVLHEYEVGMFENGVVSGIHEDGTYDIYILNPDGLKVYGVPNTKLLLQFESGEFITEIPSLSTAQLFGALGYATKKVILEKDESMSPISSIAVGSGVVLTGFWAGGHVILKWNGEKRVEINLFTYKERKDKRIMFQEAFISQLDHVVTLSRDEHPRGYGSVVNFASEMENTPYWINDLQQRS